MGTIEATRKAPHGFLAPELRASSARLVALEKNLARLQSQQLAHK